MAKVPYGRRKTKILFSDITYGPRSRDVDELMAFTVAGDLLEKGYRRTSNAFCTVARIDREDWLDVLATALGCAVADFYNKDGTGVGDRWRDMYVRKYSADKHTVHPEILYRIKAYF